MAISTIALIIYFALIALQDFAVYTAPTVIFGIVALVIAVALLLRH